MKLLRLAAWTVWFMLGWTALAHAEPISAGIALISGILAKGGIGAALIKLAFGAALQFGSSLLKQAMGGRRQQAGITAQVQVGGSNSLAFIVGTYATAGQLEYVKTVGSAGDGTPNACLVQVITLSDLPVTSISNNAWIDGAKVTRNTSVTDATSLPYFGPGSYPFNEYFWHKWYFLFAKYRLGTETAADPQLVARLGSGDNPWQSDMIGRGLAQVILTAEIRQEFFSGLPSGRWEVQGIKLYDPRKDSTVGGSGAHRWGQPATYEFSDNPVVIIYNLLRGIFYDGQLVYGPAIPATRMPLASWFAAMNECDIPVALAGGGTERQFRSGLEIKAGEDQPIDVIRELLKSCNGKMVENGGVYKIKVGAPGLPVYFVNDESFVVTDEQEFNPFPGLENTFNGASATYPEPASGWEMKDAPQRLFPEFVAEDDGRELLADFQFNAVPFPTQVQRLMASMVRDARRFREHRGTLGPAAFVLEPLDVISWTSAREGYSSKIFQIESMDDQVNGNQSVALRETDPSDFDWNFSTDELPWSVGPLDPQWPAPQLLAGWAVAPAIIYDNAGRPRRPSIEVFYDGGLQDVAEVRVVVRLLTSQVIVFDGYLPYDYDPDMPVRSVILNGNFLPDTEYEVSGVLVPKSPRDVAWSLWLYVKTDNIRLGELDIYLPGMVDEILEQVGEITEFADYGAREALEWAREIVATDGASAGYDHLESRRQANEISVRVGETRAYVREEIFVAVGPESAIALQLTEQRAEYLGGIAANTSLISTEVLTINSQITAVGSRIDLLETEVDGIESRFTMRAEVVASPGAGRSRWVVQVQSGSPGNYVSSTLFLEAEAGGLGSAGFLADRFYIYSGNARYRPVVVQGGVLYADELRVRRANIVEFTATWAEIRDAVVYNFVATSANIGYAVIGDGEIAAGAVTNSNYGSNSINLPPTGSWQTVLTVPIASPGGNPVMIYYNIRVTNSGTGALGTGWRLLRNGVVIKEGSGAALAAMDELIMDNAGAGSHTYQLVAQRNEGALASATGSLILQCNKK